jgi:pimeloyl-ACP methyl ester carboxylesterase
LLVPGISTPCLALGGVAHALVDRGCRVLLLDLWGRGYSDSVVDLPHDSRLYTTQILLAITSSPLAWTPEGFSLIGYSLGGGIVADFASYFPEMVRAVVLLAPAGLLRPQHFSWQSRLLYSGLLPAGLLERLVKSRLRGGSAEGKTQDAQDPETAVSEEIRGARDAAFGSKPLSRTRPGVSADHAVEWQLDNHAGFVGSFVSSMRYSSIGATRETREAWRRLGLRKDNVLIIVGSTDPIM